MSNWKDDPVAKALAAFAEGPASMHIYNGICNSSFRGPNTLGVVDLAQW